MNYGFNRKQFHQDVDDFVKFFTGFTKSYGPSAKKVSGKEIGFFEEIYIRFRIWLVELGIAQIIRLCIAIVAGMILWVTIFRNAMIDVKVLTLFLFLIFYGWLMDDHLMDKGKPVSTMANLIVGTRDFGFNLFEGIKDFFSGIIFHLFPWFEKKKK